MKTFALILLTGALGALVGWLFAGGQRATPVERVPGSVVGVAGGDATPGRRPGELSAATATEPPGQATPAILIGEALAREFPPLERTGTASIQGKVTDEECRPQRDVMLVLEPKLPEAGQSLRERIAWQRELEALTRRTTTNEDGLFRFDGLPGDCAYSIRGHDARGAQVRGGAREIRLGDSVELHVSSIFTDRGSATVHVMLKGKEVPYAEIQIRRRSEAELSLRLGALAASGWSAAEPDIPLRGGEEQIRAFLDGEYASGVQAIGGNGAAPVILELEPCSSVFGRIEVPPSSEHVQLFVSPRRTTPRPGNSSAGPAEVDLKSEGVGVRSSNGGFRLTGLPPGPYLFGVTFGASPIARTWDVEVNQGLNEITLALETIPDEDCIAVTVSDPEGNGMEGIKSFSFKTELARGTRRSSRDPFESVGSQYCLRLNDEELEALAGGRRVTVAVNDERWATQEVDLVRGQREYAIAYPPQAELEVALLDYLGSGFEGTLYVSVYEESKASDPFVRQRARQGPHPYWLGECLFRNLNPGRNVVEIQYTNVDAGSHQSFEFSRQSVDLAPGMNRVEIPLRPRCTIEMSFPDEFLGRNYYISRKTARGSFEHVELRKIETSVRTLLPPGEYSVAVEGDGRRMFLRVEKDASIEFKPAVSFR